MAQQRTRKSCVEFRAMKQRLRATAGAVRPVQAEVVKVVGSDYDVKNDRDAVDERLERRTLGVVARRHDEFHS